MLEQHGTKHQQYITVKKRNATFTDEAWNVFTTRCLHHGRSTQRLLHCCTSDPIPQPARREGLANVGTWIVPKGLSWFLLRK